METGLAKSGWRTILWIALPFAVVLAIGEYALSVATNGFPMNDYISISQAVATAEWDVLSNWVSWLPIVGGGAGVIAILLAPQYRRWIVAIAMIMLGVSTSMISLGVSEGILVHVFGIFFAPFFLLTQLGGKDGDFYADGLAQFIAAGTWTLAWATALVCSLTFLISEMDNQAGGGNGGQPFRLVSHDET